MTGLRQRVFLSYSKLPATNSQFVRGLAHVLRSNGFEPWLDEEQIAGGGDFEDEIRQAVATAQHGLFVVTRRWLERPYTRMEISLFARHDIKTHARVALLREEIDPGELTAHLQYLHLIKWLETDPEPDARLWEVYAALTRQPPGPRNEWPERGRRLIVATQPAPLVPPVAEPEMARVDPSAWVKCPSRPVLALLARDHTVLLTDGSDGVRVEATGIARPIGVVRPWAAAAVGPDAVPVVCQYDRMLVRLRGDDWEYRALADTPLSVATGPAGLAVGDASGGVTLFPPDDAPRTVRTGSPVADLALISNGAVVLGLGGELVRVSWSEDGTPAAFPSPNGWDRALRLFELPSAARVGLFSADAVGVLEVESGRTKVGKPLFPDGVRVVVPLGSRPDLYAVLTDAGRLFHLDPGLTEAQPVQLPGDTAEVTGIAKVGTSGLFAWTTSGVVFLVARDRTVRRLAGGGVVLAASHPTDQRQVQVVRWAAEHGVKVESVRIDAMA